MSLNLQVCSRLSWSRNYAAKAIDFISPYAKYKRVLVKAMCDEVRKIRDSKVDYRGLTFKEARKGIKMVSAAVSESLSNRARMISKSKQIAQDCNVIEESFLSSFMQHVKLSPTFHQDEYEDYEMFFNKSSSKYFSVILQAMCFGGRKAVEGVHRYGDMRSVIVSANVAVRKHLESIRRRISKLEEISHIGKIAANGDGKIGELVAKAFVKVGKDGSFIFSDEHEPDNELEFFNKMTLHWSPISPYFINNQEKKMVLKNPLVLICEDTLSDKNVVEQAIKLGRTLLIVTEDIEDNVVGSIVLDKSLKTKVYVSKPSKFQENRKAIMLDLAIFTGGQVLTKTSDFSFIPQMIGSCNEVTIHKSHMIIIGGSGSQAAIEERCDQVKMESQAKVRKAVKIVKIAVEEGILPGDGIALLHASKELDKLLDKWLLKDNCDGKIFLQLFQNALKAPVYTLAAKDGYDASFVVKKLLEQDNTDLGYDPIRGEYVDVIKSGVYDLYPNVEMDLISVIRAFERACWIYYKPDIATLTFYLGPQFY